MIVQTEDLGGLQGRVTMVDGAFDPLHHGHIAYFEAAAKLGSSVLCNVSSDDYVRTKHPPLLPAERRALVIDAVRHIDYVHLSRTTTVAVLRLLRPRVYAKGLDWRSRLPEPETAACRELGIEIVFLDSVRDSSTRLLENFRSAHMSE